MHRHLLAVLVPAALVALLGLQASSCTTDSETPNASYGSGNIPGALNSSCRSDNSCEENTLVCIVEDDGDNATCRARCDATAAPSTCPDDFLCVRLRDSDNDGACIPISGLGGPCGICDTDLSCVGGTCLQECAIVDGGSDCPAPATCESPDGGPEVCTGG